MTSKVNGLLNMVPDGYHTRNQVARLIKCDPDTLRRWVRQGRFVPQSHMTVGALHINLFSEEDVQALKELKRSIKIGRPPKFDPV